MSRRRVICGLIIFLTPPLAAAVYSIANTMYGQPGTLGPLAAAAVAGGVISGGAAEAMVLRDQAQWKATFAAVIYGMLATPVYAHLTMAIITACDGNVPLRSREPHIRGSRADL